MRHLIKACCASLAIIIGTLPATSDPIFQHDGWSGFKRKNDPEQGCIMGKHTNNGVYFLVYSNVKEGFSLGASSSAIDNEIDTEIAGSAIFDHGDPVLLVGTIIEPEIALLHTLDDSIALENKLRNSKQVRLNYGDNKLGIPLTGSSKAIDKLRSCAGYKTSTASTTTPKHPNQITVTGTIKVGTLDSGIESSNGWYSFMTRSEAANKIFKTCKMDDRCRVTIITTPQSDIIKKVLKVQKLQ